MRMHVPHYILNRPSSRTHSVLSLSCLAVALGIIGIAAAAAIRFAKYRRQRSRRRELKMQRLRMAPFVISSR